MTEPVLFDYLIAANGKRIGIATLNAPQAHNALSLAMISSLAAQLSAWAADSSVACVVLRGAGEKAFCAGGDVVAVHHAIRAGDFASTDRFFTEEYELDYAIHTYPKPILVWGHGIVMGGGVGLMSGASHRIVTERSRIAMPEITIGLYPDVGGSWFLSRLPGRLGLYLGLTGASLNAEDALFTGFADFALPSTAYPELIAAMAVVDWQVDGEGDKRRLSASVRELARTSDLELPPSPVRSHFDAIQAFTDYDTVDDMVAAITSYNGSDDWLRSGAQKLSAGSPTSMRLVAATQKRARLASLKEVFAMELNVSRQCCRAHDFAEGVRALLIDKDGAPKWSPAFLEQLKETDIEHYFTAPV